MEILITAMNDQNEEKTQPNIFSQVWQVVGARLVIYDHTFYQNYSSTIRVVHDKLIVAKINKLSGKLF